MFDKVNPQQNAFKSKNANFTFYIVIFNFDFYILHYPRFGGAFAPPFSKTGLPFSTFL